MGKKVVDVLGAAASKKKKSVSFRLPNPGGADLVFLFCPRSQNICLHLQGASLVLATSPLPV